MIAVISDIHGNFPALESVISEIEASHCETIISLGDVAGYYCQINECIDLLRGKNVVNVMGNHDYYLVENKPCPRSSSATAALAYQRSQITSDNFEWLKNSVTRIDRDNLSFVHGGWIDLLDEYLVSPSEDYFRNESARYFFSGHTHIQSLRMLGTACHCNPGSVGQPRDHNPEAAYALFDGSTVHLKRIRYDIDRIAKSMKQSGFSDYFYKGLYFGEKIGQHN